jgi:predicted TIM-barrel fold metal-dependent hydrolase
VVKVEAGSSIATPAAPTALTRIDVDTHNLIFDAQVKPYLATRWQRYLEEFGLRQQAAYGVAVAQHPLAARTDAWGPEGQPPGLDPELFCRQLLEEHQIDLAILNPTLQTSCHMMGPGSPSELIAELARAGNDYERTVWLDADPRFRGAICVPFEDPRATTSEIERCATDERFVQILLPFRTRDPLGQSRYWEMYEAAEHYDLPISLHPALNHGETGSGWPSFYFELHAGLPSALYAQLASLIFEGVFDRFPKLRVVFQEGGWGWIAPFMHQLDRSWRLLRSEVPDLLDAPSEYVRRHLWFTTQPIEEPERPEQFVQLYDQFVAAGLGGRLMFSSDYPHWDFDAPDRAIPHTLSEDVRNSIFSASALECYPRIDRPGSADLEP